MDIFSPTRTWQQIVENTDEAVNAIVDHALNPEVWGTATWISVVLGTLALGLKIAKFIPGWGPVAGILSNFVDTKMNKEQKKYAKMSDQAFYSLVDVIDDVGNEGKVGDIKKKVDDIFSPEVKAAIKQYKAKRDKGTPSLSWISKIIGYIRKLG